MSEMIVLAPPETNAERISPFKHLPKKHPWEQRVALIREQFPSIDRLDWYRAFREDPELHGRIIADILKTEAAKAGKPGKRPALDPKEAAERYRQLFGEDFTVAPFTEAFLALVGDRSIRAIAHKTGLDRNYVHKLMKGADPTVEAMEKIAVAFKKDPGYFAEYRTLYITGVIARRLEEVPEASVSIYRKVKI